MYQHPTFQNHIGMSTHFVNSTTDSFVINDTLRLYVDSGSSPPYISFRIPYLTISEWKNYLKEQKNKGTPVTVHYALINPIYESIKLPNIGTGVGTNNFTIESNIPPSSVKLFYYKNR